MRAVAVLLFAILVLSCNKYSYEDPYNNLGEVIFVNESSYNVSIHDTSFDGPLIVDKLAPGDIYSTAVPPSNNYGSGSVFPIIYWYFADGEDFWIGGTNPDPNDQIKYNINAGQKYLIYIPEPSKLEGSEAFFKVLNTSGMSIELNRLGNYFKQVNGELPVPSGKTGIYKIESSASGVEFKGYSISQSKDYPIPEFTAKNGFIYNFEFNGTSVIFKGEQEI